MDIIQNIIIEHSVWGINSFTIIFTNNSIYTVRRLLDNHVDEHYWLSIHFDIYLLIGKTCHKIEEGPLHISNDNIICKTCNIIIEDGDIFIIELHTLYAQVQIGYIPKSNFSISKSIYNKFDNIHYQIKSKTKKIYNKEDSFVKNKIDYYVAKCMYKLYKIYPICYDKCDITIPCNEPVANLYWYSNHV